MWANLAVFWITNEQLTVASLVSHYKVIICALSLNGLWFESCWSCNTPNPRLHVVLFFFFFYFIKWLPWFPLFFRGTQVQVAHYKPVACACLWLFAKRHRWPYFCSSCSSTEVTWGTLIFFSLRRFPFNCGNEFLPINVISVKVKGIIDRHPGLDNLKIKIFSFLLYSLPC